MHRRRTRYLAVSVVFAAAVILGCESPTGPVTGAGAMTGEVSGPQRSVTAVAWSQSDGTWRGSGVLAEEADGWSATLSLTASGDLVVAAYDVDADGRLTRVGRDQFTAAPADFDLTVDDGSFSDVELISGSIQGRELTLGLYANAIAGVGLQADSVDGTFQESRLYYPRGIATDGIALYIADAYNHTIRRMSIATGEVTTLAGRAGAAGGADSADGTGATARFERPGGITADGQVLFVTDGTGTDSRVRRVDIETGETTTIASSLDAAHGIAYAGGFLYVAEFDASVVSRIDPATGARVVFAGQEHVQTPGGQTGDGTGSGATFENPWYLTSDGTALYATDANRHTVRRIDLLTAEVVTIAGSPDAPGSDDGTGAAARFRFPAGLATDGTALYVADWDNHTIRSIDLDTHVVSTIAGVAGSMGTTWGFASNARFGGPRGITTDGVNLYVTDEFNHLVRKIQ